MKFKYKAIPRVPRTTCTAEQKIAYNIAWRLHLSHGDEYKNLASEVDRLQKCSEMVSEGLKNYTLAYDYKPGQYNLEAIQAALEGGLQKYFESKYHIAGSYEEIGQMFPAYL